MICALISFHPSTRSACRRVNITLSSSALSLILYRKCESSPDVWHYTFFITAHDYFFRIEYNQYDKSKSPFNLEVPVKSDYNKNQYLFNLYDQYQYSALHVLCYLQRYNIHIAGIRQGTSKCGKHHKHDSDFTHSVHLVQSVLSSMGRFCNHSLLMSASLRNIS